MIAMDKIDIYEESKENVDSNDSSSIFCAICLDTRSMACHLIDTCEHRFCFECLFKWSKIQNFCPLCQQKYSRIENKIVSEQQLNMFEKILTGIRRDTNSKNFALRKLLKSPKWKDLDNFWNRVVSTGVICKRKIVIVLLIDANKEQNKQLMDQRVKQIIDYIVDSVDDDRFGRLIDSLLKSSPNNIFLMTLIVCCRKKCRDKK